jgi:hypothetical protein
VRVEVDVSDLLDKNAEAIEELDSVRAVMASEGRQAASVSRQTHDYVNRTGRRTQRGTSSVTEKHGGDVYTLVTINVDHASYLLKGGTRYRTSDLTAIEGAVEDMEQRLEYFFDGLGSGLDR